MGEVEQEIYALMGVSPLIYAEQASTDPKSVLVYVKSPGEELVEQDSNTEVADVESEQPNQERKPKTRGRKAKVKTKPEPEEAEEEVQAEEEVVIEEEAEPTNGRRRRRRRSSAKEATV